MIAHRHWSFIPFILTLLCGFSVMPLVAQEGCDPRMAVSSEERSAYEKVFDSMDYSVAALDAALAGDFDTAYFMYECGIAAFPEYEHIYILHRSAVRAFIEGDFEGALADVDRAEPGYSDSSAWYFPAIRRIFILLEMQDYTTVIDYIATLRQSRSLTFPDFDIALRLAYRERGILNVEAGDYAEGRSDLETAYRQVEPEALLPEDAPAMLALGRAAEALSDYAAAGSAYTTYVRLADESADPEIVARVAAFEEGGIAALMPAAPRTITETRFIRPSGRFIPAFFSADSRVVGVSDGVDISLYDTETGAELMRRCWRWHFMARIYWYWMKTAAYIA
jgi:tetratricopeptide (TPR) repeat protein